VYVLIVVIRPALGSSVVRPASISGVACVGSDVLFSVVMGNSFCRAGSLPAL